MNKQEIQKAINHLTMLRRLDSGEKKGLYDLAISALEKQIPKKRYIKFPYSYCPVCNENITEESPNYCPKCGQAIDWGNEDE